MVCVRSERTDLLMRIAGKGLVSWMRLCRRLACAICEWHCAESLALTPIEVARLFILSYRSSTS
jgi:hypothetical protein